MKTLITHLLRNNLAQITSRSLLNCHAQGLHSIMLLESPGQTIRLYICESNHEMWKNAPEYIGHGMSIGFHSHHCNLTLHCVQGQLYNWSVEDLDPSVPHYEADLILKGFLYQSQINTGTQGFKHLSDNYLLKTTSITKLKKGKSISLPANEMHTVSVNSCERAAWLVYEGMEDPLYVPMTYSNQDLTQANTEGKYQKMLPHQVVELCKQAGLIDTDFAL